MLGILSVSGFDLHDLDHHNPYTSVSVSILVLKLLLLCHWLRCIVATEEILKTVKNIKKFGPFVVQCLMGNTAI